MFTPAQLLRKCSEQRPSNKGDPDSSVKDDVGCWGGSGSDLIFLSLYVIIAELRFEWHTLYLPIIGSLLLANTLKTTTTTTTTTTITTNAAAANTTTSTHFIFGKYIGFV